MIILHLEASPGWGGQEIRSLKEAIGMKKRGHTLFFAVEKGGGLIPRAEESGFKVYKIKFKKIFWPFTLLFLIGIIIRHKVDIINTHSSNDGWIGGLAGRLTRVKIIRTRHLSTPIRKGLNSYLLYNLLSDFVVTTCSSIVETISFQSKKDINFCKSIPTGVDTDTISFDSKRLEDFRQRYHLSTSDFLVGTACFMRSWKGIDDFLLAADLLREEKRIKWLIIGGGHADKYLKRAKELKLEDSVIFTGHLEHPFPALASLDLFLLLSTAHEGVSQASLQACYLEKPIIGTPIGGITEVCIHNETGILVPPHSALSVKEAVLKLFLNSSLRSMMGKNARKLVLEKFTYKQMLDKMEEVYAKVLKN